MSDSRPNPDQLLARVQAEEDRARRGKLRIFFGYAAGVGKTYAMLSAARREREEGNEVVVGYVEPHGRVETEALLEGFETIPPLGLPYRGVTRARVRSRRGLEAASAIDTGRRASPHQRRRRAPRQALARCRRTAGRGHRRVDHAQRAARRKLERRHRADHRRGGARNAARCHVGTGRRDRINRHHAGRTDGTAQAGKVYIPPQAERALQSFFQKSNLVALRELSLRQTATRLQQDVEAARRERAAPGPWATSERLLVCVGPSPTSAKIIRTAKRMAAAFGAEWLAVAVESREPPQPRCTS